MKLLVTNDDGIDSVFLHELVRALLAAGHELYVVAPRCEQSWIGAAKSRNRPVHAAPADAGLGCPTWIVDGTPSDCVNIAIAHLLPCRPAAVLSGINVGMNASLAFIIASGTVAGAWEGALHGLPAVAISQDLTTEVYDHLKSARGRIDEELMATLKVSAGRAAALAPEFAASCPSHAFVIHNLNFPYPCRPGAPVRRTVPARVVVPGLFSPQADDGTHRLIFKAGDDVSPPGLLTDRAALAEGCISHSVLDYTRLGLPLRPSMIEVENLTRVFRTYKKQPGFWGGVKGLFVRQYEEIAAAKDITFSIKEGEFVGFLGPNGAGKTTTLKMLSGLILPTSGASRVAGYDPSRRENAYRRIFALVMGQKNQLWWDLPAIESFVLLRAIYGIPAESYQKTLDELLDLLDVRHKLNVMVRELSLGERMKMELIAALLHRPKVLFLDEPTIGLDVVSQKAVRQFLREYNRRHRVTILLTSHYMDDIKELCHRVIVIHKGRKIYDGDLNLLESGKGSRTKIITFMPKDGSFPETWKSEYGETRRESDGKFTLRIPSEKVVAVSQEVLSAGSVADITIEDVPLEDIIAELFQSQ